MFQNIYIFKHSELDLKLFNLSHNSGKSAAIHEGIRQSNGDYNIVQDADLGYDSAEFSILLKPITDSFADVVFGSRFIGGRL